MTSNLSEYDIKPAAIERAGNQIYYRWNIHQVEKPANELQETRTIWQCSEIITDFMPISPNYILKIAATNPFLFSKSEEEIKAMDITLLENLYNLKRYARGYKIYSKYFDVEKFEDEITCPAVSIDYSLIYDESGILTGEKRVISWYNTDDQPVFTKTSIENYSAKDAAKILKDIRETRILYLQNPEGEFINEQVRAYITLLFNHYKQEVSDYILSGSKDFENAINTETDQNILSILNAQLPVNAVNPHLVTIKESILYQITE